MGIRSIDRLVIGIVSIAILGACGKGEEDDASAGGVDTAAGSVGPGTQGPANSQTAGGAMSDANIFYALDAVNMADSARGSLAATKGTSADVRDFGNMMAREHHTLRQQGQDLAKRLVIQPAPPPGDRLPAKRDSAMSRLTAAAKGRDFDKAYVDHEVVSHREMLTIVTSAMRITQNSELKYLIQKAAPVIQAHLDAVEAVQKNLQQ